MLSQRNRKRHDKALWTSVINSPKSPKITGGRIKCINKTKIKVVSCSPRVDYRNFTKNIVFVCHFLCVKLGCEVWKFVCVTCLCVCVWFVCVCVAPEITWFDKKSIFAIFQNHIRKFEFCLEWIIPCYFAIGRPISLSFSYFHVYLWILHRIVSYQNIFFFSGERDRYRKKYEKYWIELKFFSTFFMKYLTILLSWIIICCPKMNIPNIR